jgi:nitrogen-specific signal transduction histidine kinase
MTEQELTEALTKQGDRITKVVETFEALPEEKQNEITIKYADDILRRITAIADDFETFLALAIS